MLLRDGLYARHFLSDSGKTAQQPAKPVPATTTLTPPPVLISPAIVAQMRERQRQLDALAALLQADGGRG